MPAQPTVPPSPAPDASDRQASAPGSRQPLIAFVHVPKTAGTALTNVLRLNEPGAGFRPAAGNVFQGSGGVKEGVTFERLREQEGPELERVRIMTGHFPLGLRRYLPADRDVRLFTFLREPRDRTLSHFFAIREGAKRRRGEKREPLPPDATLEEALAGGWLHDNLHTRMLCGQAEPFGPVTAEMLEDAKRNLREQLSFFGITERFDESLVLARRRLGLAVILYRPRTRANASESGRAHGRVNAARPRGDEIPTEMREVAERCNEHDLALYEYAGELFDATPERAEPGFEVEVAALRAARAEGEVDVEGPAPESFPGTQREWEVRVRARAALLRQDEMLADARKLAVDLSEGSRDLLSWIRE